MQYKPEPGVPYRPVLAGPQKLKSLRPGWSDCSILNIVFQGIDPPTYVRQACSSVLLSYRIQDEYSYSWNMVAPWLILYPFTDALPLARALSPETVLAQPTRRIHQEDPKDSAQPASSPPKTEPSATPPPTRVRPQDVRTPSLQPQSHKDALGKPKDAPTGAHTDVPGPANDKHVSNKPAPDGVRQTNDTDTGTETDRSDDYSDDIIRPSEISLDQSLSTIQNALNPSPGPSSHLLTSRTEDVKIPTKQTDIVISAPQTKSLYASDQPDQQPSSQTQKMDKGSQNPDPSLTHPNTTPSEKKHSSLLPPAENPTTTSTIPPPTTSTPTAASPPPSPHTSHPNPIAIPTSEISQSPTNAADQAPPDTSLSPSIEVSRDDDDVSSTIAPDQPSPSIPISASTSTSIPTFLNEEDASSRPTPTHTYTLTLIPSSTKRPWTSAVSVSVYKSMNTTTTATAHTTTTAISTQSRSISSDSDSGSASESTGMVVVAYDPTSSGARAKPSRLNKHGSFSSTIMMTMMMMISMPVMVTAVEVSTLVGFGF